MLSKSYDNYIMIRYKDTTTVCQSSLDQYNFKIIIYYLYYSLIYKMGQDFLDILYHWCHSELDKGYAAVRPK